MKIISFILLIIVLIQISNCSQLNCLNCPQGTIWNRELNKCFQRSELAHKYNNQFSHCLAYHQGNRCIACEKGYYLANDQCYKNPQQGDQDYIENCLEYDSNMNCKKCAAPLSFYNNPNSKKCINASTWFENCALVSYYDLKKKDVCTQCQEGYHISETWGGCYRDPQPGQLGYVENCRVYSDWGQLQHDYVCDKCDSGYSYERRSKQCKKFTPVPNCAGYSGFQDKRCYSCEEGHYLYYGQCLQCDYQGQLY